jgi:glutathione S-transferase
MLTLIHAPLSRSSRIIWLLEELDADYDIRYVDIRRWDGSGGPDENNPHPHKQVPALLHDGTLIWESVAVVQYLTDLYPDCSLSRPPGHRERRLSVVARLLCRRHRADRSRSYIRSDGE